MMVRLGCGFGAILLFVVWGYARVLGVRFPGAWDLVTTCT